MAEPLNLLKFLSSPQSNTSLMEGSQVGSSWRPANICFSPSLQETFYETKIKWWVCESRVGIDAIHIQNENYRVFTYRSLLSRNWFFHISPEYGRSVTCLIYNTELITAVLIFKPRAKVTLEEKKYKNKKLTSY